MKACYLLYRAICVSGSLRATIQQELRDSFGLLVHTVCGHLVYASVLRLMEGFKATFRSRVWSG